MKNIILKECRFELVNILTALFKKSIDLRHFPTVWKIGMIIPVENKVNSKIENDFRPITLTYNISKVFERLILKEIKQKNKQYMDVHQFAYSPNRSTEDALALWYHEISRHLDKGKNYARCLFADFSSI